MKPSYLCLIHVRIIRLYFIWWWWLGRRWQRISCDCTKGCWRCTKGCWHCTKGRRLNRWPSISAWSHHVSKRSNRLGHGGLNFIGPIDWWRRSLANLGNSKAEADHRVGQLDHLKGGKAGRQPVHHLHDGLNRSAGDFTLNLCVAVAFKRGGRVEGRETVDKVGSADKGNTHPCVPGDHHKVGKEVPRGRE